MVTIPSLGLEEAAKSLDRCLQHDKTSSAANFLSYSKRRGPSFSKHVVSFNSSSENCHQSTSSCSILFVVAIEIQYLIYLQALTFPFTSFPNLLSFSCHSHHIYDVSRRICALLSCLPFSTHGSQSV